jgi:hypothetical protein
VAYPRVRVYRVGQVYTPVGLIIDSNIYDIVGYE